MDKKEGWFTKKHLSWIIIGILIILSILIIQPYVVPLAAAFILAYLVKPLYTRLATNVNRHIAASICLILIIAILILPLSFLITNITTQAYEAMQSPAMQNLAQSLTKLPFLKNFNLNIQDVSQKGTDLVIGTLSKTFSYIPSIILALVITLFGAYYLLINWETIIAKIQTYFPFKDKTTLFNDMSRTTNTLIYGSFVIAIIEFIIAAIVFNLMHISSYLVLAFLIGILAFIPGIGPTIIWAPLALFYILTKNYSIAISVIILGILLSTLIDTILRGKIMSGRDARANPLVVLIGILGGLPLFGVAGLIIGPLILIYTIRFLQEAIKEGKENQA